MTVTNTTPAMSRGGVLYANAHLGNVKTVNTDISGVSLVGPGYTGPGSVLTQLPDSVNATTNIPGYYTASADEGVYAIHRFKNFEFTTINRGDTDLSEFYRPGVLEANDNVYYGGPPAIGTAALKCTSMPSCSVVCTDYNTSDYDTRMYDIKVPTASLVDTWPAIYAPGTAAYVATGKPVVVPPGMWDNSDWVYTTLVAPPGQAQSYHIKAHYLYEFLLEPGAGSLFRGMHAEPDEHFVDMMNALLDATPRFLPASANLLGAITNAIKGIFTSPIGRHIAGGVAKLVSDVAPKLLGGGTAHIPELQAQIPKTSTADSSSVDRERAKNEKLRKELEKVRAAKVVKQVSMKRIKAKAKKAK